MQESAILNQVRRLSDRYRDTEASRRLETIRGRQASHGCMSGWSSVLPFPASGGEIRTKKSVDHRNTEEAALVRRVQAKDEIAFQEIVERYQAKVFSIIYGILRNHNDAEDIAQQVFAKIYFSIRNFDFRSSLLTWIYKITVNECYDYLRKKRVRKLVYESDFSEEDALRMENTDQAVQPGRSIDTRLADRDLVTKLLSKVSAEDRMLILLKEVEGHSVEELAEMTGMNQNTVKVKLFRARQKLLKAAQRLTRSGRIVTAT
jgi:RNA polymerase sigma-70 factor (ECF subfamily)